MGRTRAKEEVEESGRHLHVLEFFCQWWTSLPYIVVENAKEKYKCAGVYVQADTHTDEDRREPSVVNGITGSWKVR